MLGRKLYGVLGLAAAVDGRRLRSLAVLGLMAAVGLALGACSKCDVPIWQPNKTGPLSCHDGPSPQ